MLATAANTAFPFQNWHTLLEFSVVVLLLVVLVFGTLLEFSVVYCFQLL